MHRLIIFLLLSQSILCKAGPFPKCTPSEFVPLAVSKNADRILSIVENGCASIHDRHTRTQVATFRIAESFAANIDAHNTPRSNVPAISADGEFVIFGEPSKANIFSIRAQSLASIPGRNWYYFPYLADRVYVCIEDTLEERSLNGLSRQRSLLIPHCGDRGTYVTDSGVIFPTGPTGSYAFKFWDGRPSISLNRLKPTAAFANKHYVRLGYDGGEVYLDPITLREKNRYLYPGYTAYDLTDAGLGTRVWNFGKRQKVFVYDREIMALPCTSLVSFSPEGKFFAYTDAPPKLHRMEDEDLDFIPAPTAHNSM